MSDTGLFILIFSGVWGLLGLVFLAVGIALRRSALRKAERRRARASGTVVELARHVSHSDGRTSVSWNPVVEFEYEGRRVTLESEDGVSRRQYYEGQSVEVLYDPDDPACFGIEGNQTQRRVYRVMLGIGAGCVAVAVVAALLVQILRPNITVNYR